MSRLSRNLASFPGPHLAFRRATDGGCLEMRKSAIQELGFQHSAYYVSIIVNIIIVLGIVQITSMKVFRKNVVLMH